jgi:hypothetical protein
VTKSEPPGRRDGLAGGSVHPTMRRGISQSSSGSARQRQHQLRSEAAARMQRLDCCSCRDPLGCRHHDHVEPPSPRELDGAVAAAHHLLALDLPPLFPLDVCRALWPRHRELAVKLAKIAGAA